MAPRSSSSIIQALRAEIFTVAAKLNNFSNQIGVLGTWITLNELYGAIV